MPLFCVSRWGDIAVMLGVREPGAILSRKPQKRGGILQGCSWFFYFQPQYFGMWLGCWETYSLVLPIVLSTPWYRSRSQELLLRMCPKQGTCVFIPGHFSIQVWAIKGSHPGEGSSGAPLTWLSISILWSHLRSGTFWTPVKTRASPDWKLDRATCGYRLIGTLLCLIVYQESFPFLGALSAVGQTALWENYFVSDKK